MYSLIAEWCSVHESWCCSVCVCMQCNCECECVCVCVCVCVRVFTWEPHRETEAHTERDRHIEKSEREREREREMWVFPGDMCHWHCTMANVDFLQKLLIVHTSRNTAECGQQWHSVHAGTKASICCGKFSHQGSVPVVFLSITDNILTHILYASRCPSGGKYVGRSCQETPRCCWGELACLCLWKTRWLLSVSPVIFGDVGLCTFYMIAFNSVVGRLVSGCLLPTVTWSRGH